MPHGAPCWFELATPDQAGAKSFYGSLFDWTAEDSPMGPEAVYTTFLRDGVPVAAACPVEGVLPHWGIHFTVDDVDAAAAAVPGLGGTVLKAPFDVMTHGRMAVVADQEGATAMLWQPGTHSGAGVWMKDRAVMWVELATRDADAAAAFYGGILGWETKPHPLSPTKYLMFSVAGAAYGGLLQMTKEWGDMPSHWSIYLQTPDTDGTLAAGVAAGGKVVVPAFDAPSVGRIGRLNDPAGAGFYVMKPFFET
jgi:uncharacterized protein